MVLYEIRVLEGIEAVQDYRREEQGKVTLSRERRYLKLIQTFKDNNYNEEQIKE